VLVKLKEITPEDEAHRRGVLSAGGKCVDGIQGHILPFGGAGSDMEVARS
jgi:hypothetical protein